MEDQKLVADVSKDPKNRREGPAAEEKVEPK